ncbi:hypothetical protein PVNG_01541 [Plasmodium vivax North Korean]|uniref:Fam-m protein n=1 Tax=Plasmodium vivax North Korean TaxID=1035514 RepID=A0A0J9U2X3_PLAVI|nr:hypothetical protein PVNG_01541 [Plasmodium vivax North Korean]
MKLLFSIYITTFVVLNWLYNPRSDIFYAHNCLDAYYNDNRTFHIITHRTLAKDDVNLKVTETIHNNGEDYISVSKNKETTTYHHLNHDKPNKLEAYKKSFNYRYAKKKGVNKFDCYCERKIFKGIEKIDKIAEDISNKNQLKRLIYKKYGLRFILFFLFTLIGIIIPILNACSSGEEIKECNVPGHDVISGSDVKKSYLHIIEENFPLSNIYFTFIIVLGIIIFFSSIYILTKIIKYDELKNGKRII